jgi:heterotetrameric sarcosine oxidase gamma subunit
MTTGELRITQLPVRNMALLQVDGVHDREPLSSLIDKLVGLGNSETELEKRPHAYTLSATECLLFDFPQDRLRRSLRSSGRIFLRVTDVSSAFSLLRVAGAGAGSVLDADLAPPVRLVSSRAGWLGRARVGAVDVIIQRSAGDSFDLYVVRGLSRYLEDWLRARWLARFPAVGACVQ